MTRMPDIEAEAAAAVGWFEQHLPHRHAAPQTPAPQPANPAPAPADATAPQEENPMGFVTDIRNDLATAAHDVAAKAADFEQNVLPAVAEKLTALENNPVIDSLLNAVHVPPEALAIVVKTIEGLESLYAPAQPAQQPVTAGQQ